MNSLLAIVSSQPTISTEQLKKVAIEQTSAGIPWLDEEN